MIKTSVNTGHELANKAEHFEEREDWYNAILSHDKAAIEFENALKDANDIQTQNTLQLLTRTHLRKSKELQRKLSRVKETTFDMRKLEQEIYAIQKHELGPNIVNQPITESFALLPNEDDDSEDPFNKFWGVVEPMMNKLSNPVAFASAPLHENDDPTPIVQQRFTEIYGTAINEEESNRIEQEMSSIIESFFSYKEDDHEDTTKLQSNSKHSIDEPRDDLQENEKLKAQIQQLTGQIQNLEKKTQDSTLLKNNIAQFKNDVHKQALRIIQTQESTIMTRSATTTGSALSKNIRTIGTSTAEIVNRIKVLEEENRSLRSQNRKQAALMTKYKERWERLKEGAKRRHTTSAPSNPTLLRSLASSNPPALSTTEK
ncbi:hypothetical protein BDF21DRAFT_433398 [Thamnidium elegans]|nr:hypothetical protein BDF21DRAFT_433398 [Thamnidium elegans]